MKYEIQDWAGNRLRDRNEFDSFEDAWGYIYDVFEEDDWQDIYVIPITEGD